MNINKYIKITAIIVFLIIGVTKFQLFSYILPLQNIIYENLFTFGINNINKYFYKVYQIFEFTKKNILQKIELMNMNNNYYPYNENFEDNTLLNEQARARRRKKLTELIGKEKTNGSRASRPPRNSGVAGIRTYSPDSSHGWIPVGMIPRMWKHKLDELRLIIISLVSLMFFIIPFLLSPNKRRRRRYWRGFKRLAIIKWYWLRRKARKAEKSVAAFYTIKSFYYNRKNNNMNFNGSNYKLFLILLVSQTSFYKLYFEKNFYYDYIISSMNKNIVFYKIKYLKLAKLILKYTHTVIRCCAVIVLILIIMANAGGPSNGLSGLLF
jgi:hypothetical protein